MYGHIYRMAEAEAEGARTVVGAEVNLYKVPELVPEETLVRSGAKEAQQAFTHVPVAEVAQMADADAIIFGTPTRYGMMCAQMRNFLDQSGGLWVKDKLVDKVASVFTSSATQHGGQETTITGFFPTLMHLGFIIVGVTYAEKRLSTMDEISGGTPYGASSVVGHGGARWPTENELEIARQQGRHVALVTRDLLAGRNRTAE